MSQCGTKFAVVVRERMTERKLWMMISSAEVPPQPPLVLEICICHFYCTVFYLDRWKPDYTTEYYSYHYINRLYCSILPARILHQALH